MFYSLSYYVEHERYWQFAGEFDAVYTFKRAKELADKGLTVRVRCLIR